MQWQTTIMITWAQWRTGGAMLWYLIKHTNNSLVLVIFTTRKNPMNVNLYIAMLWTKNLVILISIISMLLHVTIPTAARLVPATLFGCPTFLMWYTSYVSYYVMLSGLIFVCLELFVVLKYNCTFCHSLCSKTLVVEWFCNRIRKHLVDAYLYHPLFYH